MGMSKADKLQEKKKSPNRILLLTSRYRFLLYCIVMIIAQVRKNWRRSSVRKLFSEVCSLHRE
jgi:hypothetical protein